MLILGLLGMYFDAAVVFFTISSLFFWMAMAVLCLVNYLITLVQPSSSMRPLQHEYLFWHPSSLPSMAMSILQQVYLVLHPIPPGSPWQHSHLAWQPLFISFLKQHEYLAPPKGWPPIMPLGKLISLPGWLHFILVSLKATRW